MWPDVLVGVGGWLSDEEADFETFAEGARADVTVVLHDSTGAWEGPTRVAREKAADGWDIVQQFGYSTVLRRATGYATE